MDASNRPCPFCSPAVDPRVVAAEGAAVALLDAYPVTPGHTLIVPRRHASDFFALTEEERRDLFRLADSIRERMLREDPAITGFNLGMNCGSAAGQTIPHAHLHLIPRRDGDVENPRGGVRGVIPAKQKY
jgi:diadenosine tetraphosphate (Ap4A) HIT family hydrolase